MKLRWAAGELGLLGLAAGLAAFGPRPGWAQAVVAGGLCLAALALCRARPEGRLPWHRVLVVPALFVLLGRAGGEGVDLSSGRWLLGAASLLVLAGLAHGRRFFSQGRVDWLLAGLVTLAATAATAGVARAALALRSDMPLRPGSLAVVEVMLVWAAIWYGADTHLRALGAARGGSAQAWLWERRHALALLGALSVMLLRAGSP